jgi:hypothetical protein
MSACKYLLLSAVLGCQPALAQSYSGCSLQFRALSDQLYRSPVYHGALRDVAVQHLRTNADMYAPYVEGDFEAYLRSMSKPGTWGDHLTLQVFATADASSFFMPHMCLMD